MINIFLVVTPFTDAPEILIFAVILGIFLMYISRSWGARIYSILAAGVWLYIAIVLREEAAIVIVMIGLIFVELYHAFIDRSDT